MSKEIYHLLCIWAQLLAYFKSSGNTPIRNVLFIKLDNGKAIKVDANLTTEGGISSRPELELLFSDDHGIPWQ